MPKKKKLKLGTLEVSSFITAEESRNIKGMTYFMTDCADTDCESVEPNNLCAVIGTMYCDTPNCETNNYSCNGTCNSCVSCLTCDSCPQCVIPSDQSGVAICCIV
jgi:hypothetical protein